MFVPGGKVYKALVKSSDSTTGEIYVAIPNVLGDDAAIPVSFIGRSATNGVWAVPTPGTLIAVGSDDDQFSNVFWFQTSGNEQVGLEAVKLRRVAPQSFSYASGGSTQYAYISWDTEDSDTSNFISVTSDTLTVPAGLTGLYSVVFVLTVDLTSGTLITAQLVSIEINGIGINVTNDSPVVGSTGAAETSQLGRLLYLEAGDTLKFYTRISFFPYNNGSGDVTARLWMTRIMA